MPKLPLPRHPLSLACLATLCSLSWPALAQQNQPAPAEAAQALPEIVVTAKKDANTLPPAAPGGQAATGVRLGILGNTELLNAPFSASSYTQQTIKDQQARTLADVLQNDPSVRFTTNSGHMLEHFRIRGLDVNGPDVAFNGLYGVAPTGHVPTEFLERVEVLRGPNALLSGMSPSAALGGMINLVPKRAGARPLTELTTSYSSKSYGQVHLDVGRRFGDDERLGVRFNGAYGTGDTGVADQKKGRELGAIALDYQGDRWNVTLDAYSSHETIDNGSPAMYGLATRRGGVVGVGQLVSVPDSDTNLFRGTHGTYQDQGLAVRGEMEINNDWSTYVSLGASNSHGKGLMFGTRVIVTGTDGTARGYVYNVDTISRGRVGEVGLRGRFATGSVTHQLNVSATSLNIKDGSANTANENWAQNIYNPVAPVLPAAPGPIPLSNDNVMSSLGVADTLTMADGKVLLTLGTRLQRIEQKLKKYAESKLSPSLGVVLKPWGAETSLYANYMEGLSPGETVAVGFANANDTFKPIQTRQAEVGLKWRQSSFTHTFSAFQIKRPTLITNTASNTRVEGGKQRVQGLEWITFGKPATTLSLLGGVTYQQAEQRNTGLDSWGVPDWTANVGAEWTTPLSNLSLNGRLVYNGKQWVDSANTLRLPSSTRLDVGAKYVTALASTPVTLNAFVENVTGRDYWSGMFSDGYVMSGPPRTLRLAATFSF